MRNPQAMYKQPFGPNVAPNADSIIANGLAAVATEVLTPLRIKELEELNEILNQKTRILAEDLLKAEAENKELDERVWMLANQNGDLEKKNEIVGAMNVSLNNENKLLRRRLNGLLDLIARE
jgi:hypothetical protein